ncbi:SRPBCC family protein [Subtercola lobariae]|uniref:Activator of Hsp90 ATPase homologue 1/2-like C-terminal domain-containing protein n=1 Tax=Subtercola lobariae TaxID=1588641 RepID=A0A917B1P0_9MICO|nr:SRPBCC family protein [Subtercola lobariae]GGF16577.1 hypothetical protein GCM10011399_07940 [Subtercola lobariae]
MAYSTSTSFIDIAASTERVWAAVTRPELVLRWQYGSHLITDWSVGGPIRFISEWEGQRFEQWGTVLEFSPAQSLKYTLFAPRADLADVPENYFVMTYTLTRSGDSTRITIVQEDPRPSEGGDDLFEGAGDDGDEFEDELDDEEYESGEGRFADDGAAREENPVLIALKELCEE